MKKSTKKRFLLFVFKISYIKKTTTKKQQQKKQQQKNSEFVSDLIASFIIFNKYIKDITIVIFRIRIVI